MVRGGKMWKDYSTQYKLLFRSQTQPEAAVRRAQRWRCSPVLGWWPPIVHFPLNTNSETHSVHYHPTDLKHGHVGLLAVVAFPHDSADLFQSWVRAVEPGQVTLRRNPQESVTRLSRSRQVSVQTYTTQLHTVLPALGCIHTSAQRSSYTPFPPPWNPNKISAHVTWHSK